MTLYSLIKHSEASLVSHYQQGEARWLIRAILEEEKGWTQADVLLRQDMEVSDGLAERMKTVVGRLLADEPIQYIYSHARFHGLSLRVTPDVLIPRPETAQLVDIIIDDYKGQSDLRVTDICTGSGCIALALARSLPFAQVTAVDISPAALEVAEGNAKALNIGTVGFVEADVLAMPELPQGRQDIVVSNPPYVMEKERATMEPNVLDHEPAMALFVPDGDPLLFYRAISGLALKALKPGGRIYLEINPMCAITLEDMMTRAGWSDVTLLRDMQKNLRFLTAVR